MAQTVHRPSAPLGILVAGGAVVLALLAAAVRPPWEFGPHGLFSAPAEGGATTAPPPTVPSSGPIPVPPTSSGVHLGWVPWVVLGLALVLLGLLLARWLHRREGPEVELEDVPVETVTTVVVADLPTLRRGAVAADERLLAIGDPTDAIVAAWLALEEAAGESGVPRPPASTPTEYTAEVLRGTGAPADPVRTLLGLYLRARFAAGGAGVEDLTRARSCVRELAEHWRAYAGDRADAYPAAPASGTTATTTGGTG